MITLSFLPHTQLHLLTMRWVSEPGDFVIWSNLWTKQHLNGWQNHKRQSHLTFQAMECALCHFPCMCETVGSWCWPLDFIFFCWTPCTRRNAEGRSAGWRCIQSITAFEPGAWCDYKRLGTGFSARKQYLVMSNINSLALSALTITFNSIKLRLGYDS